MGSLDVIGVNLMRMLPPEVAHNASILALKTGLAPEFSGDVPASLQVRLPVSGLKLPNPVGLAAGYDKNAEVSSQLLGLGFGFVECGTVTPMPQPGNPKPRLFRLKEDSGVINRMGFNNQGLQPFVKRLQGQKNNGVVGANVGANKTSQGEARLEDYAKGVRAVWPFCSYVTLNVSSPNTPGLRGLQGEKELTALVAHVAGAVSEMTPAHGSRPVFLKIAPDMDDDAIVALVDIVLASGCVTGLIVSNTTVSRPKNLTNSQAHEAGGLSGSPLFDLSTHVLKVTARHAAGRLDIIGVGGVKDAATAYAKIRAGAHAIQLYSALALQGLDIIQSIQNGLDDLLVKDGFSALSDAVGADL